MKLLPLLICAGCLVAGPARARAPVTVTIDPRVQAAGVSVSADFVGLRFETSHLRPDDDGKRFSRAQNHQLVSLFKIIGIKNLRIGGAAIIKLSTL
jgi:hypothetical protein